MAAGGDHILVLCDTYTPPTVESDSGAQAMQLHPSNNRAPCERVMRAAAASEPVFSCEQQYSLLDPKTGWPVGAVTRGASRLLVIPQVMAGGAVVCGALVGLLHSSSYSCT